MFIDSFFFALVKYLASVQRSDFISYHVSTCPRIFFYALAVLSVVFYEGRLLVSGCTGFFPINYTQRTAETDSWTLHK